MFQVPQKLLRFKMFFTCQLFSEQGYVQYKNSVTCFIEVSNGKGIHGSQAHHPLHYSR